MYIINAGKYSGYSVFYSVTTEYIKLLVWLQSLKNNTFYALEAK